MNANKIYRDTQQAIENWINPWLHILSLVCVANKDLSENSIKDCIKEISTKSDKSFHDFAKGWTKYLQKDKIELGV